MIEKPLGHLTKLTAEKGYIHKKGTDTYVKSIMMLPSDSINDYEEVDEIPKYTREDYVNKVRELISTKYTLEDELAIQRQRDTDPDKFKEYFAYCEECKAKAREELGLMVL